ATFRGGPCSPGSPTKMRTIAIPVSLIAALALGACARSQAPAAAGPKAASQTSQAENPGEVVASWGDTKITMADLDKSIEDQMKDFEREMRDKKFEMRQSGLDQLIAKKLVAAEAAKRGMTEDQVFKAEVDDKVP